MGAVENYYNVRDASGRFTAKKGKVATPKAKRRVSKKVDSVGKEIYDLFILDKSSSMSSIKESTINGYNERHLHHQPTISQKWPEWHNCHQQPKYKQPLTA